MGIPQHLAWHEERLNSSRRELWPGAAPIFLEPLIVVPSEFSTGIVRCNVRYDREIRHVSFKPYEKRSIRSLKLVHCDTIDYHVKFADRSMLESLLTLRGDCDEIIIVKNGLLTDTSMSNLIFKDGNRWITPAKPLLKGTCRERMIAEGLLSEADIRPEELTGFAGCRVINAMRPADEEMMIPVDRIFY